MSKKRAVLGVGFAAVLTMAAITACSSHGEDPAPTFPGDVMIYDASADTTKDTGIAKWGYDERDGAPVFRGYDAKGKELVVVRQRVEPLDENTNRVTVTMTGTFQGESVIDVGTIVSPDYSVSYTRNVQRDTFDSAAAQGVLEHLVPDSFAMAQAKNEAAPLLTQNAPLRTQDLLSSDTPSNNGGDAGPLVGPSVELLQCCSDLVNTQAAQAALVASACGLTSKPQNAGGGGIGAKDIVVTDAGLVVKSPWNGNYNIVNHHCHHAAAENVDDQNGYIGCVPASSTTTYSGHTVSWRANPGAGKQFCVYEPQANGGTEASGRICCFDDTMGANGAPSLSSGDAKACVTQMCLGQAYKGKETPKAFPPGQKPPLPADCSVNVLSLDLCTSCCATKAADIKKKFPVGTEQEIDAYRCQCAASCQKADSIRNPMPTSDQPGACIIALLKSDQSSVDRTSQCGRLPKDGGK